MLLNCPECEQQISDKAIACPHCGYPLAPEFMNSTPKKKRKRNKRRRLPNGFGQISEIKNQNLRKPFRAMVTVGKTTEGRPICKMLKPEAYFKTYNDAYAALVEYNKNPYDLNPAMTVNELYENWMAVYSTKVAVSSYKSLVNAWLYCSTVYDMRAIDLRARHIKDCMENGKAFVRGREIGTTASMRAKIKSLFNLMLDYGLEYEIVEKNYARTFNIDKEIIRDIRANTTNHIPFTDEEMEKLWENVDALKYVAEIIIQCYSGWRPQEMCFIKLENVDLEEGTFVGGMKTDAGINRMVPIHPKIKHLVERKYKEAKELGSEYLFNSTGKYHKDKKNTMFSYTRYANGFSKVIDTLGLNKNHKPHDGRTHFVTMAKKYKVDEYAIKYIVGHSITDITEKVYTKRNISWLKAEIEKIK